MIEINKLNFDRFVTKGEGWKLLQFYSPSCVLCQMNEQVLKNNEQNLGVTFLRVDGMSNPELVEKMGVTKAPTVFLISDFGVVTKLEDGLQGKQLLDAIKEIMCVKEE